MLAEGLLQTCPGLSDVSLMRLPLGIAISILLAQPEQHALQGISWAVYTKYPQVISTTIGFTGTF